MACFGPTRVADTPGKVGLVRSVSAVYAQYCLFNDHSWCGVARLIDGIAALAHMIGGHLPSHTTRVALRMRKTRRMPSGAAWISPTTMAYPNSTHPGGAQGVNGNRHRFFDDHRQHGMDI